MRSRRGAKTAMPKKNKSQWQKKKKKDHSRSHYLLGGSGHHYEQKEDNCKDREQVLARPFFFPLETSNTVPETGENRKVNAKNSDCSGRRCASFYFFFRQPRFFFSLNRGSFFPQNRGIPGKVSPQPRCHQRGRVAFYSYAALVANTSSISRTMLAWKAQTCWLVSGSNLRASSSHSWVISL